MSGMDRESGMGDVVEDEDPHSMATVMNREAR